MGIYESNFISEINMKPKLRTYQIFKISNQSIWAIDLYSRILGQESYHSE